ncbi:type II toxin-antitoxin system HipA family toxin [Methylophaga sp. OBS3]|uniref:type II toxin-antitoxin system HipA family toxin n=1 Tax=Methylophaga sp. OBS3 TaxID=2991934 RepID=UPI00225A286C|nr:type II toxin-antitoxin system HipA family toxin [Methylophaga sp. OBS3]MCX4190281.1 type II toxin-antitoxin system HipA family toxin [Methylophaga sp. OBS3]
MSLDLIEVKLWGKTVGAIQWDNHERIANFNYDDEFIASGLEVSPFMAPLDERIYRGRREEAFAGLPEFIADSLPDKFGNAIITAYFDKKGITVPNMTPLDKLAYIGERAMGALTYDPMIDHMDKQELDAINLSELVSAARQAISGNLHKNDKQSEEALNKMLSVGISAGGARAKAVINYNPETGEMKSGQFPAEEGYEPWLIKFDGVGKDNALGTSENYGRIEYAYYLMASDAGVDMSQCQLLEENGRAHFMTKRFDRTGKDSIHMQSFCAMKGLDFNMNNLHSYEQYFHTVQTLTEDASQLEQAIRRCFLNIAARNQDDHTKNFSFLMNKQGEWSIAPAFDVIYAFNPNDGWTSAHQMSVNGKFKGISATDLITATSDFLSHSEAVKILEEVLGTVDKWMSYADRAGLSGKHASLIQENHRSNKFGKKFNY